MPIVRSPLNLSLSLSPSLSLTHTHTHTHKHTHTIRPYRPLIQADTLDGIQCPHRTDACKFSLGMSMYRSIKENVGYEFVLTFPQYSARLARLTWMVSEIGEVAVQLLFCGLLLPRFFQNSSYLAFTLCVLVKSRWCIHTVVPIQLGRNPALFYRIDQNSISSTTCQQQSMPSRRVCWHRFQLIKYCYRGM